MAYDQEALEYHEFPVAGKIKVVPTKPCFTQRDLSLAYTPGVAVPCLEIEKNPADAYRFTAKGNLVAVVSNGTAVLGLGNIGALAGKPVMEGKGVLFNRFAKVDVFDIELDTEDPDEIIRACELMAPTFGGINLEDIKAPECFYIEETLIERMDIPVFHDDQHGTAIISGAALLNACEVNGKAIRDITMVMNGAGAAGIACAKFYESLGVPRENIVMCDSKGVIYKGREDMDPAHPRFNKYKAYFATLRDVRTLEDAMEGADAFSGVSVRNTVSKKMVQSMANDPIIFAMANPDPEITYPDAMDARSDVLMATGRSDYPNQVNNVLGFPFIFRGALDVRARKINEEMKVAAAHALADLAKEDVPDVVLHAYNEERLHFGRDYLIPKPFDPRVLTWEALAVAKAAVDSGVARINMTDWEAYRDNLEEMLGAEKRVIRRMTYLAQAKPQRIVFAEGTDDKVLRAAQILMDENVGTPVLLGRRSEIEAKIAELDLHLQGHEIIDPQEDKRLPGYVEKFYAMRQRKGIDKEEALRSMRSRYSFGPMMVYEGDAEIYISGRTRHYPTAIRPMLNIMSDRNRGSIVAGVYMVIVDDQTYFLSDCALNINPDSDQIVKIAEGMHELVNGLGFTPRIGLLSFSNFGSARHASSDKMRAATEKLWELHPDWEVDGELQADAAIDPKCLRDHFPFAKLKNGANCLVFPDLNSANIAFRLLKKLGGATTVGPILTGLDLPMHVLSSDASVDAIVNVATIAAVQQMRLKGQANGFAAAKKEQRVKTIEPVDV